MQIKIVILNLFSFLHLTLTKQHVGMYLELPISKELKLALILLKVR